MKCPECQVRYSLKLFEIEGNLYGLKCTSCDTRWWDSSSWREGYSEWMEKWKKIWLDQNISYFDFEGADKESPRRYDK